MTGGWVTREGTKDRADEREREERRSVSQSAINRRINRFKEGFGTWNAPRLLITRFHDDVSGVGKRKHEFASTERKEGKLLINNYRPTRRRESNTYGAWNVTVTMTANRANLPLNN